MTKITPIYTLEEYHLVDIYQHNNVWWITVPYYRCVSLESFSRICQVQLIIFRWHAEHRNSPLKHTMQLFPQQTLGKTINLFHTPDHVKNVAPNHASLHELRHIISCTNTVCLLLKVALPSLCMKNIAKSGNDDELWCPVERGSTPQRATNFPN